MLSRKSISSPLWRQIAAETALQSGKKTHKQTHTGSALPNTTSTAGESTLALSWSIQLLALDFTFFTILSVWSIKWKHSKIHLRVYIELLSIWLSFTIKNVEHKHLQSHSFIRNSYKDWVKQIHSPSKHRTSESILSLYPAEAPALVFLWEKKSGVIRRSSYVCHLELKGPGLNFKLMSFPHFDFHPIM